MKQFIEKIRPIGFKIGSVVRASISKIGSLSQRLNLNFLTSKVPIRGISQRVPLGRLRGFKLNGWVAKAIIALVILLGLAQVVFAVLIYGFHQDNKAIRIVSSIMPFPVAIANTDIITYKDYLSEKDYIHHFYAATKQEGVGYDEIDKQILDQLIENKLVSFQAARRGIKVEKVDVDQSIATIIEQNGGQDKVEKVLDEYYGISLQDFRRLVNNQLLRDKINDELIEKISARHILVQVAKDASADQVDEARKKADGYLAEIKAGLDFADAAKKYSQDTGSAEQGGLLEAFSRGEMVKEFSDAAFTTSVGQISEPVRSEFGWHIIKVESKTGTIDQSFNDWLVNLKSKSLIRKFI